MTRTMKAVAKLLNRDEIEIEKHWRTSKKYASDQGSKKDYLLALQYLANTLELGVDVPQVGDTVVPEDEQSYVVFGSTPVWCLLLDHKGHEVKIPLWVLIV